MLAIEQAQELVEWADVVWITDVEYSIAQKIKKIRKVPVAAHIRSYALICPWWGALYGFREPCLEKCSAWRNIRCNLEINLELAKIGVFSGPRDWLHLSPFFARGAISYFRLIRPMDNIVSLLMGL